jgi:hypothetical protein
MWQLLVAPESEMHLVREGKLYRAGKSYPTRVFRNSGMKQAEGIALAESGTSTMALDETETYVVQLEVVEVSAVPDLILLEDLKRDLTGAFPEGTVVYDDTGPTTILKKAIKP